MTLRIGRSDLDDLVVGATLLGSGGGGEAALYAAGLRRSLPVDGLDVLTLDEAAARGFRTVAPVGMIGATSVLTEKLPSGDEIAAAVAALNRWTGEQVDALMPVECAGVNATLPVAAAHDLGLPLLDADLMGRALPRFDQLSLVVEAPDTLRCAALGQPTGQVLVLDESTPHELERTVRSYVAHAGGWAGAAFGPMRLDDLVGRTCDGTLTRALELGRLRRSWGEEVSTGTEASGGLALGAGRVVDVVRASTDGFARTSFAVVGRTGPVLRVEAENEYLAAILDGEPVATCPDLICVLERRGGSPVPVDALRLGDDVQVIAMPGPRWWVGSASRLEAVGPRAFGIDLDPVLLPVPA